MTLEVPAELRVLTATSTRRNGKAKPLNAYVVFIRPLHGTDPEQYWIDGRSKIWAKHRAARLAGVSSERVLSVELFRLAEENR